MAKVKKAVAREQPAAQDFEKLGVFYLGRPYDLAAKTPKPGWLLYDSKDLVTHAVCVGMTGSGKTGLCLGLLEEAAIDGIPAIVIDPKGDLANLMLTFPELRGQDFAPWINEDDARKEGVSPSDYAAQQAELWKKGLSEWGQSGERIQKLKDEAEFVVYTPGSNAGVPVSILNAFYAPDPNIIQDVELLRDQIGATVTGLLGLVSLNIDPINSPPHILLSAILEAAWRKGQSLDLIGLIQQVQTPPFTRMGALDIETFYPAEDPTRRDDPAKGRFSLTKRLNNLIAAPSFEIWKEGDPLDIDRMLYASDGKPRVSIFSIAHLNDAERMFFVTLLLSQVLAWMRRQSGTTSLRAILYMDEIFGYFPPVANPPSKAPLLTLLKQGRAFGLGIVLATQNPVDLDYKGLSNTGTWFVGRLQTERDKARLLDGLEGAAAGTGQKFDRKSMEQTLAGLGKRIFLLSNVHEDRPEVFETRWTLSYLRGPLTRNQIKSLMESHKDTRSAETSGFLSSPDEKQSFGEQPLLQASRPILPASIHQCFLPIRGVQPTETSVVYQPMLLGAALVGFTDAKHTLDLTREVACLVSITKDVVQVDWNQAIEINVGISELEQSPQKSARYASLLPVAGKTKAYEVWGKEFVYWLYQTQRLELFRSPTFKEVSRPGESERDFRVRLQQSGREQRDKQSESLRKKYAPKIAALQERKRRAEQAKEREAEQATQSKIQTAVALGATLLEAFTGRKAIKTSTIGKATTAIRGASRAMKDAKDVGMAEENIAAVDRQIADLNAQFQTETDTLLAATDPLTEKLETVSLKPTKANISVRLVALAWTPHWQERQGKLISAWG